MADSLPHARPPARPTFADIDAWGITHKGKVRPDNQDHFFVGALAKGVTIDATSLVEDQEEMLFLERVASLGVVADGVGGHGGGKEAARIAVSALVAEVSRSFHHAELAEREDPEVFSRLLHEAALEVHESLLKRTEEVGEGRRFSTTMTFFLGLWPHAYLLQLGDSRCYIYKDDVLTQISRDQTWAQDLVDSGILTQTKANQSRWAGVLSSAMGAEEITPVVTRVTRDWGTVVLICSDGLTAHVSDELIEKRLAALTSSRETAEQLLQDALDGGGTDNITIIVGRTRRPDERR